MNKLKYFSMFSGIGGFELGIQYAYEDYCNRWDTEECSNNGEPKSSSNGGNGQGRWTHPTCIGYSEINKYAIQIYEKHFKHKNYGDATKIITSELPDFDLLVGGFPCQAFSIAGKRKGFDDTRGTLFFDIARILADKKPKHLVLENVKGLLSHEGGRTFTTIIRVLTDLGYFVEWQVLNAKNFGVPQNRERVFIVGHLGGQPRPKVFPIGGTNKKTLKFIAAGGIKKWNKDGKNLSRNHSQGQRVYGTDGLSSTMSAQGGGWGAKTGLYAVLTPDRVEKRQNGRRMKKDGEPSFTLTGQDIHGVAISNASKREFKWQEKRSPYLAARDYKEPKLVLNQTKIRRLTPLECERLMGYPDNWTQGLSDTQRYKCCGNGIVSNVVKEVIKRIYE